MTSVVRASDLARLRNEKGFDASSQFREEKAALKAASDARVAKWGNTIEASRDRKHREWLAYQDRIEEERVIIEKEEAEIKAKQRAVAIQRANKIMHDHTDSVRKLHSTLLHSEVMAEREKQIAVKEEMKRLDRLREEQWEMQLADNIRALELREAREKADRDRKNAEFKASIHHQMDVQVRKFLEERAEDEFEGKLALMQAQKEIELDKAKELKLRAQRMAANESAKTANQALESKRELERQRDQIILEQIENHAREKAETLQARKDWEQKIHNEKLATRQKMIDKQIALLESMRTKEDETISRYIEEQQEKRDRQEAEKEANRRREFAACDKSRQRQLERKRVAKDKAKAEDAEYVVAFKAYHEAEEAREKEEAALRRQKNVAMSQRIRRQQAEKYVRDDEDRVTDLAGAAVAGKVWEEEDRIFREYAGVTMDEYNGKGKDIKPVAINLGKKVPLQSAGASLFAKF